MSAAPQWLGQFPRLPHRIGDTYVKVGRVARANRDKRTCTNTIVVVADINS